MEEVPGSTLTQYEEQYRSSLLQILIAAEEDAREGRVVSHEEVVAETTRTTRWFQDLP
jgi:predicted transcriptional regulator